MENEYFEQRLKEIGEKLFAPGAFFENMPENERDIFGEGIGLFAKQAIGELLGQDGSEHSQRLDEIGEQLFAPGAFFESMPEHEKDLFGEALKLIGKKSAEDAVSDGDDQTGHVNGSGDDLANSIREVLDFARGGGFNINVNVNPNHNMYPGHEMDPGHHMCGDMNSGDMNGDYKGDTNDEYYNDGGNGEYYGGSGSGYAHTEPYPVEKMNDGMYNEGEYNPDEMMYGEDMPMEPKEENYDSDGTMSDDDKNQV
jgi:hypothetical protein